MTELVLRRARAADAEPAAALLRASISRLCAADHGGDSERIAAWCANKTPERVRRWITDPDQIVLVAERDGMIAGLASASRGGTVLLNYVAPEARFSGVSDRLLARLEAELAALGLAEARLDSTETARGFYLARGWRPAPTPVTGNHGIPMVKRLAPPASD